MNLDQVTRHLSNLDFSEAAIRQVYAKTGKPIRILGRGSAALVWRSSRGRAVKVTTDADDAAWLASFAGRKMRFVVRTFQVFEHHRPLISAWVIEMELLEKLNPLAAELISRVADDIGYDKIVEDFNARKANQVFQEELERESRNRDDLDWEDYRQMAGVVQALEWLASKRMYFLDLHGRQFGVRPNGEVVLFDLGINPSPKAARMTPLPNPAGGARPEKRGRDRDFVI